MFEFLGLVNEYILLSQIVEIYLGRINVYVLVVINMCIIILNLRFVYDINCVLL